MGGPPALILGVIFLGAMLPEGIGQNLLCPTGAIYYVTHELCYWDDSNIVDQSAGQAHCAVQNGTLALIPDPWAAEFLLKNLAIGTYATFFPVLYSKHWWIGYQTGLLAGEITTNTGQIPPWLPPTLTLLGLLPQVSVSRQGSNPETLAWEGQLATTTLKSLCSKFSKTPERREREWVGVAGRLAVYVMETVSMTSRIRCASLCHLRHGCASFNFNQKDGVCELCRKFKVAGLTFDSSATDFQHFELSYRV